MNVYLQDAPGDQNAPTVWRFSTGLHCPESDLRYAEPLPAHFSFNSALGACPSCRGFGRVIGIDWGLVIPDEKRTLRAGAIKPIQTPAYQECQDELLLHAVIHDQNREKWNEGTYIPLQNVAENQAPFVVIDSILSEEAVLGFEYGYASNDPNTLVIFTPKSLLRNKDATSPLSEFTKGGFQTVIPEHSAEVAKNASAVKRVIACSGKVYYDLVKKREEKGAHDVAILRVEQLYPFPHKAFAAELKRYPNATDIVWCQDEPQNQGAWFFIQHNIHDNMLDGQRLGYAGRAASASPAVGYAHLHQDQQKTLIEAAFGKLKGFILSK